MTSGRQNRLSAFSLLVAAALLFFLLHQFSLGRWLLWPFVILTTYIHEMGHGIAALLVGGHFHRIDIFSNAAGQAWFSGVGSGLPTAAVAAAGLLAPALAGSIFIVAGTREKMASRVLLALCLIMLISCALWVRSLYGLVMLGAMVLFLIYLANHTGGRIHQFLMQFFGVHFLVDSLTRTLRYLFVTSAQIAGQTQHSDSAVIAQHLGGGYVFWGIVIASISILLFAISLKKAYL